jgi:glycosyltransferase involved in cell wall biosynthesis
MKLLVSILIPSYSVRTLSDTIRSEMADTWQFNEVFVVDDGSSDGTAEVAWRFASKEVSLAATPPVRPRTCFTI